MKLCNCCLIRAQLQRGLCLASVMTHDRYWTRHHKHILNHHNLSNHVQWLSNILRATWTKSCWFQGWKGEKMRGGARKVLRCLAKLPTHSSTINHSILLFFSLLLFFFSLGESPRQTSWTNHFIDHNKYVLLEWANAGKAGTNMQCNRLTGTCKKYSLTNCHIEWWFYCLL